MNDFQIYLFLYINYLDISPPVQACTGIAGGKEGGSFRVGRVLRPLCRPPFPAWKMAWKMHVRQHVRQPVTVPALETNAHAEKNLCITD